jgi:ERF superfamily
MNAVVEHIHATQPTTVAVAQEDGLLLMIERALTNPNIQVEKLNALLDMKIKWDAEQERKAEKAESKHAEREFTAAMVEFKKLVPKILKDKHVEFNTQKGVTSYDHATIGAVCDAIIPALASAGLTHSWEPRQDGKLIRVTCTLAHPRGHKKSVSMESYPDDSGTKNALQANRSAMTYMQRYTLLDVCGVATGGMPDDDGRASGPPLNGAKQPETIKAPEGYVEWSDNLRAICDEGREALLKVWKGSPMPFRAHMTKYESARWDGMKKLAEGVTEKLAAEGVLK